MYYFEDRRSPSHSKKTRGGVASLDKLVASINIIEISDGVFVPAP